MTESEPEKNRIHLLLTRTVSFVVVRPASATQFMLCNVVLSRKKKERVKQKCCSADSREEGRPPQSCPHADPGQQQHQQVPHT